MHDNDNPFIRQKPIYKNHNRVDEIFHSHVPKKNEREGLKACRIERLDDTFARTRLTLSSKDT
jgi:hypothetical protein